MNPQVQPQPPAFNPDQNNPPAPAPILQQSSMPPTVTPISPTPTPVMPQAGPVISPSLPRVSASMGSSKRKYILLGIVVGVLVAVGGGVMALAGNKDKPADTPYTPLDTSLASSSDETKTAAPAMTKTPISQTITTDLGFTIQLSELVRNYTVKYPEAAQETVLVKILISDTGSTLTGSSPYTPDFTLVVGGKEYQTSLLAGNKELADAGYPTLLTEAATKDKPNSGYMAFDVPTGTDKLTFRYTQKERKVLNLGSTQTIPAKTYDVPLN